MNPGQVGRILKNNTFSFDLFFLIRIHSKDIYI
jgi:hypothetical protein